MSAVPVVIIGLLYTCLVIAFASPLAERYEVVDHPAAQDHKLHAKPTPLVGGLAVIPPFALVLLYVFFTDLTDKSRGEAVLALLVAAVVSMTLGFLDDRKHLPAVKRLLWSTVIFLSVMAISPEFIIAKVQIRWLEFSVHLGALAIPFTVICLLTFQNAVNMADGRNGLVTGLTVIWLVTLLSYDMREFTLPLLSLLAFVLLVMVANLRGRLFLGDAGSYGLGAIIGLSTIWAHQRDVNLYTTNVVTMFFLPVMDMFRLIALRLLDYRHPFTADHHHLHHYLDQAVGWNWGLVIYLTSAALPIALTQSGVIQPLSGLLLAGLIYLGLLLLVRRGAPQSPQESALYSEG